MPIRMAKIQNTAPSAGKDMKPTGTLILRLLICISLMNNNIEDPDHGLIGHLYILFGELSIQIIYLPIKKMAHY